MRTSNARASIFSSTVGKIVMALVCASMIGGVFIAPAFARNNKGYYKHGRRVYQQPYRRYYPEPVYAPPPVVYYPEPYQSPGISIVFPIRIR